MTDAGAARPDEGPDSDGGARAHGTHGGTRGDKHGEQRGEHAGRGAFGEFSGAGEAGKARSGGRGGEGSADAKDASDAPGGEVPKQRRNSGSASERELQKRMGSTERADRFYDEQVLDHLNTRMREFTQRQEMFFLATADRDGECDSSFRAGPPGFLHALDERTLIFPEYRGNGVHASLGNIQENPHLGILMIDFAQARIGLHINGRAEVLEDAHVRILYPDLPEDPVPGRRARLWVRVVVEEAYIHCAKHIPQMQRAPRRTARDWGTDDYKRKGGDFFGSARGEERGDGAGTGRERSPDGAPGPAVPTPAPAPATDVAPAEAPAFEPEPELEPEREPDRGKDRAVQTSSSSPLSSPSSSSASASASASTASGKVNLFGARVPVPAPSPYPTSGVPAKSDPEAWRQQAERALAEAQRRGAERERSSFQGWFG